MGNLDLVLAKAAEWRFPIAKGKELVFNPRKTRLEGWHGPNLGQRLKSRNNCSGPFLVYSYSLTPIPDAHKDPAEARKRLTDASADFKTVEGDPEYTRADCETYCAATLVFMPPAQRRQNRRRMPFARTQMIQAINRRLEFSAQSLGGRKGKKRMTYETFFEACIVSIYETKGAKIAGIVRRKGGMK